MELISDGNLEIVAHAMSNLCYLISLMHLIRSRTVTNRISFSEKSDFPYCATCSELPSYISTKGPVSLQCINMTR